MAIDTTTPRSRRALLLGAVGGLAATVAASLGRAQPVAAVNGAPVLLGTTNSATSITTIQSAGGGSLTAFTGVATGIGYGVYGLSPSAAGVYGDSEAGNGVEGHAQESGIGVYGQSGSGTGLYGSSAVGNGVHGDSPTSYGVYGTSTSSYGVYGTSTSSYAVAGLSSSSAGVAGFSDSGQGVIGASNTVGVIGQGGTGRGGRFSGGKAQIRLDPSTAATHPATGQAGDLFLDASKRLWLCKGGTSWVRLDT